VDRFRKSRELYVEFSGICPGGVHSSVRFHSEIGHPIYFSKAQGSKIWDIDGNEFIDCIIGFGAIILGHGHPKVTQAVKEAIDNGLTAGIETELSYTVSKKLADIIPCAESVKLSTSGTEAIMHAIHIVRGYTGKEFIMKPEGCYNGWYDSVLLSNHPPEHAHGPLMEPNVHLESAGILKETAGKTVVYPFNDGNAFANLVKKYKERLAGIIIAPVVYSGGCVLPDQGYLQGVREVAEENDVPLIFDEVITGFRCAPGGAQELYGVTPDIAIFGKAIANGYPLSAVVGKKEIMEVTTPGAEVGWQGTYNAHQIALAAASASLDELSDGRVQTYLASNAEFLANEFNKMAADSKIGHMVTCGGILTPYFTTRRITNTRERTSDKQMFMLFWNELIENQILIKPSHLDWFGLTAAHDHEDIERITAAIEFALRKVKESRN